MSSHRHSGTVGRVGVCGDGPARSVSRRRQRAEAGASAERLLFAAEGNSLYLHEAFPFSGQSEAEANQKTFLAEALPISAGEQPCSGRTVW